MTTDLLPCPFCGSANIDPKGWASTDSAGPACDDCGASAGGVSTDLAGNIAAWNRRASPSAAEVQALVEELRAEIKPYRNFPNPTDKVRKQCADRLAKLARDYAPEVSPKSPSPRNP